MDETRGDIHDCLIQLDNCLALIVPGPDNFDFGADQGDADEDEGEGERYRIIFKNVFVPLNLSLNQRARDK